MTFEMHLCITNQTHLNSSTRSLAGFFIPHQRSSLLLRPLDIQGHLDGCHTRRFEHGINLLQTQTPCFREDEIGEN